MVVGVVAGSQYVLAYSSSAVWVSHDGLLWSQTLASVSMGDGIITSGTYSKAMGSFVLVSIANNQQLIISSIGA